MFSDSKTYEKTYETLDYYGMHAFGKIMSYTQPIINSVWGSYFEISEIVPGVYISDFSSACETEKLKELGITHIITVMAGVPEMYPESFKYYTIDVCDRKYVDLKPWFNPCSEFMDDAIKTNGKVLVHCQRGASRSATIVAAYLISKKGYTCTKAVGLMKERRTCVNPNDGFVQQLTDYEKEFLENNKENK
jgi:protein-tyrosine phosphatase